MKMNFEYFQIQKWILQTVRSLWSLNCLKKCIFCNFVLTSGTNLYLLKQFTYMHLKGLVTHFQEISIIYYAMTYSFGDISVCCQRILLNFCWVSMFFEILITNILWTVAQTPINHNIFWKSVMRTFRCIYVNCFNRLRFFAEVSTKL